MKKGTKVKFTIKLDRKVLNATGKIKDSKKNYGRIDYLLTNVKTEDIWVSNIEQFN